MHLVFLINSYINKCSDKVNPKSMLIILWDFLSSLNVGNTILRKQILQKFFKMWVCLTKYMAENKEDA